jgi:hypothetical protein
VKATPAGLGTLWTLQLVPFHASAKASFPEFPTASQLVAELHETPRSSLEVGSAGISRFQLVPFHFSAKATPAPFFA